MAAGHVVARFLIVVLVQAAVIAGAAFWMVLDPSVLSSTALTIVCLASIPALAATAFRCLWSPMLEPFPPHEPAPDAVQRYFQSFGLGIVNMALSVHAAADDEYLHLTPLPIWRALGARAASIPWSAMEPVGKSGRVARVNGHRLDGPKWCMELVAPRSDDEPA